MLLSLLVLFLLFVGACWVIWWLPLPPTFPPFAKAVLYIIAVVVALWELVRITGVRL